MTISSQVHLSVLYQALAEPYGLFIQTSDTVRARQALYKARADSGDQALSILQVRISPFDDSDLMICHPRSEGPTNA